MKNFIASSAQARQLGGLQRVNSRLARGQRLQLAGLCLALFLLLVSALPAVADPNDGSVSGQLVNRSAGGGSPAGTPVILIAFGRKEQKPLGQMTTQTDTDGRYAFNGLDRDPNVAYITLARYQGVNYPTDQPFLLQDTAAQQADIDIYESTNADDALQLERLNLLMLGANQGVMQFMEMGALVNTGDRTFVTANPQDQQLAHAVKLALPNGALGVQMQTGFTDDDVIPGLGGVQITSPIPPGRHEFAMSFQLPYNGSSADVSMQMPYLTQSYSVYVPDTGVKLDTSSLSSSGSTQMGGRSYALYSASNIARSTMIGAQLSGLSATGATGPSQLALISLGVVLFILGGGVLLFGSRFRTVAAPTPLGPPPDQERLELVVRLAALDERFAQGEITQAAYERERDRGKQRLRELALAERATTAATPTPSPTIV